MKTIKVIVNGLPSKMARLVAKALVDSKDFELLPVSLTGLHTKLTKVTIGDISVKLFKPGFLIPLLALDWPDVIIDLMPSPAVNENVDFYTLTKIPFILGATVENLQSITEKVNLAGINAVIYPNPIKEIATLKTIITSLSDYFPELCTEYDFEVIEGLRNANVDSQGTTKNIITVFNRLGIPISSHQINIKTSETDNNVQGIESKYGWPVYNLKKKDGSVAFSFTHNLNGREFIEGILKAVSFLYLKESGNMDFGKVYTMTDVLK